MRVSAPERRIVRGRPRHHLRTAPSLEISGVTPRSNKRLHVKGRARERMQYTAGGVSKIVVAAPAVIDGIPAAAVSVAFEQPQFSKQSRVIR